MANGGTLFLDEVGDCPAELQTRLLRVLDQGEIRRVGDNKPIAVDVRIVAATHHDLEKDVEAGRFRKGLLFRLSVFTITAPPLRERCEDIPVLAQHFLERLRERGKQVEGFTADSMGLLSQYDFPGNVRELENEVERAFALADPGTYITADLLSDKFAAVLAPTAGTSDSLRMRVDRCEPQLIRAALQRNQGNQTRTATDLGLSRRALIDKIQKYGLQHRQG
jgi:two-component system response regulator HydG